MSKQTFVVNSQHSLNEFIDHVVKNFESEGYTRYKWSFGEATLDQKALFHIWLREFYAHIAKIPTKNVTKFDETAIKRKVKRKFYEETAQSFMVHQVKDPWHPNKNVLDLTSCKDWSPGEMYMVLEWLQEKAGMLGLTLEAKGEFAANKKRENS